MFTHEYLKDFILFRGCTALCQWDVSTCGQASGWFVSVCQQRLLQVGLCLVGGRCWGRWVLHCWF